jgi:hypothetical protein
VFANQKYSSRTANCLANGIKELEFLFLCKYENCKKCDFNASEIRDGLLFS